MITQMVPKILSLFTMPMFAYSLMLSMNNYTKIIEWEISTIISSPLSMTIMMDWKGCLYSSCVLFISLNVLYFSSTYMKYDHNMNRFTNIIIMFILSMNLLIFIPNLMMLLLGWDGLGITSFILVIYYNNHRSLSAGMLTMMINRLGDVFLLLAISATLSIGQWTILYNTTMNKSMFIMQWLGILLAAMTKSAQMPFSSWLPAAMAAPTPVSALVHSSTLVTAGVFILLRFYLLIQQSNSAMMIIMVTGITTTIMAGIAGIYENDMKKIIALSTLSQLGMMFTTIGMSMPQLAFFHMCTHAMFKALLFITAGCLISSSSHNQDLRLFGSHLYLSPMNSSTLVISSAALMGLPFMSGFYSKHLIMEWSSMINNNILLSLMLLLSIMLTTMYSIRLIMSITLKSTSNMNWQKTNTPTFFSFPMLNMSIMSVMSGTVIQWTMPSTPMIPMPMHPLAMSIPIQLLTLFGLMLMMYSYSYSMNKKINWSSTMNYLAPMSTQMPISMSMKLSLMLSKLIDQTWMEILTGHKMSTLMKISSSNMDKAMSMFPQKSLMMTSISIIMTMSMIMMIML